MKWYYIFPWFSVKRIIVAMTSWRAFVCETEIYFKILCINLYTYTYFATKQQCFLMQLMYRKQTRKTHYTIKFLLTLNVLSKYQEYGEKKVKPVVGKPYELSVASSFEKKVHIFHTYLVRFFATIPSQLLNRVAYFFFFVVLFRFWCV